MTTIDVHDCFVHLAVKDGRLIASTGIDCESDDFARAAEAYNNGEWAEIWMNFPVSELLQGIIESHKGMSGPDNELDIEAKPRIDALRADLVAMIAKIDGITYF